ncbi:hypothetical protein Pfo_029192 [Paulownia fortunei]|nr:hypothetical protein Pfo_029192 [Paulownia fortunei]
MNRGRRGKRKRSTARNKDLSTFSINPAFEYSLMDKESSLSGRAKMGGIFLAWRKYVIVRVKDSNSTSGQSKFCDRGH